MDSEDDIITRLLKRSVQNSRDHGFLEKGAISKRGQELEKIFDEEFEKLVAVRKKKQDWDFET